MKQKNVSGRIRRILTTALLLLVGGQLFAGSYTITFEKGAKKDGSKIDLSSREFTCAEIVSEGAEYLSGNIVATTNAYEASGGHLKLGLANESGSITMNLSAQGQVTATSIVIRAMRYSNSVASQLTVSYTNESNESAIATQELAATNNQFADYTYTLAEATPITRLKLTSDKYCYIQSIMVNYISVQVGDTGYSTLFLDSKVIIPTGVEAYYVTATGNMAYLHKLQGVIPANTGVVIKAAQGEYPLTKSNTDAESPSGNQLVGFIQDTQITGNTELAYYALNYEVIEGSKQVGFFIPQGAETPHSTFTAKANKAYLRIETPNGGLYNVLRMRYGDETQIEGMDIERQHEIYDLLGRRVEKVKKGIYIVNGKKVVYER